MKKKKIIILAIILSIILVAVKYFINRKIQQENKDYEIETISEYKYFVVKENNQYGVINTQGCKVIETKYEEIKIPNPEKDIFICYENKKTKVLNQKGQEVFTEYDNIEPLKLKNVSTDLMYEKSILRYRENEKYGIIDFNGKKITKAIYDEIDTLQFKEGELLVKEDGKYGIISIKGKILVKSNYDKIEADKFYEEKNGYKNAGYIVSQTTNEGYRYGYVNVKGKEIIEVKYNDLYRITEIGIDDIYIICAENGKYGLLKNDKQIIDNQYQSLIYNESNNSLTALKGKKYGVISITGTTIVPFEYKQINITGDYIYGITINENVRTFNSNGQEANIDENLSIINIKNTDYKIHIQTIDNKTIYNIYKNEQKITKNEYTYIQYLHDNYFIAYNADSKLGIIDDNENIIIKFEYNEIQTIENTNMIQTINNDTKIIEIYSKEMKKISELENGILENNKEYIKLYNDKDIKYISKDEMELENTKIFTNNEIFAKKSGDKWGFIDITGNKVVDYKYEKVTELNKYGFAGIKQNGKWGVINSKGKIIVEPNYELNNSEPIFIGAYYQVIYENEEIYYTK